MILQLPVPVYASDAGARQRNHYWSPVPGPPPCASRRCLHAEGKGTVNSITAGGGEPLLQHFIPASTTDNHISRHWHFDYFRTCTFIHCHPRTFMQTGTREKGESQTKKHEHDANFRKDSHRPHHHTGCAIVNDGGGGEADDH